MNKAVDMDASTAHPVTITRVSEPSAWEAYLATRLEAKLYHHPRWLGLTAEVFGHRPHYLQAEAGGRVVGVLGVVRMKSALFGDFLVSLPFVNYGGPVADDAAARLALYQGAAELAADLGVSHLEVRDTAPVDAAWPARTDKVAMLLDLPGEAGALWQALGSKLRAQVKRPRKEGAEAVMGGAELVDDFYRVFAENMRELGTPVYGKGLFRAICQAFPERTRIAVVYLNGEPTAAGFLLATTDRVLEIPWASSLRRFNRLGVNMLLYWQVLEYACGAGFRTFDFGRSSRDGGTHRFKKQWGAGEHPQYWNYWVKGGGEPPQINPNNPKYDLAIRAWRRLPLGVTRLLGPHIVRNIP